MARAGRHPYEPGEYSDWLSPAEQLVEEIDPQDEEMLLMAEADPIRPWEPKGLKQTEPQTTVEGVDLVHSDPPLRTPGGSPPGTRKKFARFGPEGT